MKNEDAMFIMENLTFEELLKFACFSNDGDKQRKAAEMLEYRYGFEIHCSDIDESVLFAHHGRNDTIVAAKISKNVVIYQNVTLGSNLKYNKIQKQWENVGSPIIGENVIIADGAKVLGPVIIGKNTVIAAGAIITKDIPEDSIAYGVNQYKPKDKNYDYIFSRDNILQGEYIIEVDKARVANFNKTKK